VPQGLLNRSLMGQRSNKDAFVDTVADLQCLDLFGERLCEFIVNAILHKNPIRRHASLPGVAELGEDAGFNGRLDLCVVEDNERTVATQFERKLRQVVRTLQSASPTSATLSRVVITLIVPLGKPACSASTAWARALSGVSPAGFQTVVHPAANAAPTFLEIIYTRTVSIPNHFRREALHTAAGKFHGAKQAATPSGCLIVTIR
jgi:hypothetical protein